MLLREALHSGLDGSQLHGFLKRLLCCTVSSKVVGRVPRASAARAGGDAPPAVPDRRAVRDQEADGERDERDQGAGQGGGGQPAGPPTPSGGLL